MKIDSYQTWFLSVITKINSVSTKCFNNKVATLLWELTLLVCKKKFMFYLQFVNGNSFVICLWITSSGGSEIHLEHRPAPEMKQEKYTREYAEYFTPGCLFIFFVSFIGKKPPIKLCGVFNYFSRTFEVKKFWMIKVLWYLQFLKNTKYSNHSKSRLIVNQPNIISKNNEDFAMERRFLHLRWIQNFATL